MSVLPVVSGWRALTEMAVLGWWQWEWRKERHFQVRMKRTSNRQLRGKKVKTHTPLGILNYYELRVDLVKTVHFLQTA